ncbi:MAG: tetratricopeptide repeat protein, partial [Lentisphaeria bacterium]|nr:tetratricopeptide repeat protein [Lentisphaeria bacterium]NQZ67335.1 tetratricopeptide repeat protein [Lentisphaeria bacterium]
ILPYWLYHWFVKISLLEQVEPIYFWKAHESWQVGLGCILILALIFGIYKLVKSSNKDLKFASAYLILLMVPALFILLFDFREFFTADRYIYTAMAGLILILAKVLESIKSQKILYGVLLLFAALSLYRSHQAVAMWKDNTAFWQYHSENYANSWLANMNYANALAENKNFEKAEDHFILAIAARPAYVKTKLNYAQCLYDMKKYQAALSELVEVIKQEPQNIRASILMGKIMHADFKQTPTAKTAINLAIYYIPQKRYKQAIALLEPYVDDEKMKVDVNYFLFRIHYEAGDSTNANKYLAKVKELDPNSPRLKQGLNEK